MKWLMTDMNMTTKPQSHTGILDAFVHELKTLENSNTVRRLVKVIMETNKQSKRGTNQMDGFTYQ